MPACGASRRERFSSWQAIAMPCVQPVRLPEPPGWAAILIAASPSVADPTSCVTSSGCSPGSAAAASWCQPRDRSIGSPIAAAKSRPFSGVVSLARSRKRQICHARDVARARWGVRGCADPVELARGRGCKSHRNEGVAGPHFCAGCSLCGWALRQGSQRFRFGWKRSGWESGQPLTVIPRLTRNVKAAALPPWPWLHRAPRAGRHRDAHRRPCCWSLQFAASKNPQSRLLATSMYAWANPEHLSSPPANLAAMGPFGLPMGGGDSHQYRGNRHPRLDGRPTDGVNQGCDPLARVPGVVRVHGLKIVGPQHQDHQSQRRMNFNPLGQSLQTVTAWFVGILPGSAAPVKAVFVYPDVAALGPQRGLHDPRPARLERQPPAGERNDAP